MANRGGHFIKEDLSTFDAEFFSISSAEAASMDPMQRWLLEAAYRALENGKWFYSYFPSDSIPKAETIFLTAGMPMESVSNTAVGVYTGSFAIDYLLQLTRDAENPPPYASQGIGLSMLSNRISWFFNLLGPSVSLDSACSSTATALDLACSALLRRSCDSV